MTGLLILLACVFTGTACYNLSCAFVDVPTAKTSRMMMLAKKGQESFHGVAFRRQRDACDGERHGQPAPFDGVQLQQRGELFCDFGKVYVKQLLIKEKPAAHYTPAFQRKSVVQK